MPAPEAFTTRSFRFACDIVQLYRRLIKLPEMPHVIARQLLRAGTSIGANLEEAVGAQSRGDVTARFTVALKEARETLFWLRLIVATRLANASDLRSITKEANELVAILTTSRKNLKARKE